MPRYFLEICYDGTNYHGWQVQTNAHSVQAEVDKALETLFRTTIRTLGCGRTDTGVHAKQFFLHFDHEIEIELERICRKLNAMLPPDISALSIREVVPDSHTRFHATQRSYQYVFNNRKDPFQDRFSAPNHYNLDIELMNKASQILLDTKDFGAFCKVGSAIKTTLCDVRKASWSETGNQLLFDISADRFLRSMVRATVGTLVQVGRGKVSIQEFAEILSSGDRREAGASARASGLHLVEVVYPDTIWK
jgi:tRNA pseudouridine38-40 synthase